jgi:hypothetical protein
MADVTMAQSNSAPALGGGPFKDWFTHERRYWLGLVAAAALVGFGIGNGHTTQGAVENISTQLGQRGAQLHQLEAHDIPKLKAQVGCEHVRAQTAIAVARDGRDAPDLSDVPTCPPIAAVKDLGKLAPSASAPK